MDLSKLDLNKPAFGEGSQTTEELETPTPEVVPAPAPQAEVEEEVKTEEVPAPSVEEQKVPYSRFKNIHQRALDAEQKLRERDAQDAQRQNLAPQPAPSTQTPAGELPDYWVELYGDSDASKRAWNAQSRQQEALRQDLERSTIEALQRRENEAAEREAANLRALDEGFEDLSAQVGRDLTAKEQTSLLDIVDEYTPKDPKGNYLGAVLPMDKAWEIYELKQKASKAPTKQARDSVAALSGNPSTGEPSGDQLERDKAFNPSDWGAWRRRL